MNFQDLISKLSEKIVYTFFEHNTASFSTAGITETSWFWRYLATLNVFASFRISNMVRFDRPLHQRNAMLIWSFRASGFNLFSRPKFVSLGLPKRFGLWMSRDCACFLFRLRNAGAYIPKGTPCTLHVSTNLHTNACLDIRSQSHISGSCYKAVCIEAVSYTHLTLPTKRIV